jgi:hypothetical protein
MFITLTPGVDIMITIFCGFWQLSAKEIGLFLKNQCYDKKCSFVLSRKTPFLGENILKNYNIGPRSVTRLLTTIESMKRERGTLRSALDAKDGKGPILQNSISAKTFRTSFLNLQLLDKFSSSNFGYKFIWVLRTIILDFKVFQSRAYI